MGDIDAAARDMWKLNAYAGEGPFHVEHKGHVWLICASAEQALAEVLVADGRGHAQAI